jgi:eukaryotic translation initiation factor 2C
MIKFVSLGADVGHPGPGILKPSVAALVWSHDYDAVKYGTSTRIQPPRLEIIEDLQAMVEEAINNFALANNSALPQKIIFFRDGVSEGEYDKVAAVEIKAIKGIFHETHRP